MAARRKKAVRKTAARKTRKTRKTASARKTRGKATPRRKASKKPARRRPPASPSESWALALAGDWSRGAFVAGALEALERKGTLRHVPVVAATGSAALAAALAALGRWDDLKAVFTELTPRRIARPRHAWMANRAGRFWLASATGVPSLYRGDALRRLVHAQVDPVALRSATPEILFVVLDLRSGAPVSVSSRRGEPADVLAAILAAASPPVLLPPVRVAAAGGPCVQAAAGAVLAVLGDALEREGAGAPGRILAIDTGSAPPQRDGPYRDVADVARRAAELLAPPGAAYREAVLLHALAAARDALGAKKFEASLAGLPAAARAALPALLERHRRPVVHLHPQAAAAAHALDLDPAGSRAAYLAGAAAADALA